MAFHCSQKTDQIVKALLAAEREFPAVSMDAVNPHYKSKYATLQSILAATQPHLREYGLLLVQSVHTRLSEGRCYQQVESRVILGDQFLGTDLTMPVPRPDAQAVGSVITYGRRYTIQALLGLAAEADDDANLGSGVGHPSPQIQFTAYLGQFGNQLFQAGEDLGKIEQLSQAAKSQKHLQPAEVDACLALARARFKAIKEAEQKGRKRGSGGSADVGKEGTGEPQ